MNKMSVLVVAVMVQDATSLLKAIIFFNFRLSIREHLQYHFQFARRRVGGSIASNLVDIQAKKAMHRRQLVNHQTISIIMHKNAQALNMD